MNKFLTVLALSLLLLSPPAGAAGDGLPGAVRQALARAGMQSSDVQQVRTRRPAPTSAGFMYEVVISRPGGGERLIYVDPDKARVIFEAGG